MKFVEKDRSQHLQRHEASFKMFNFMLRFFHRDFGSWL